MHNGHQSGGRIAHKNIASVIPQRMERGSEREQVRPILRFLFILSLLILGGCALFGSAPKPQGESEENRGKFQGAGLTDPWILVDTKTKILTLFRKHGPAATFEGTAFGAASAGLKRRRGDDITPIGRYRIASIRPSGKFKIFMELDYPSVDDAERALKSHSIDQGTFRAIRRAHSAGRLPPQNTVLGGHIGIHGLGRGSPEIHRYINWTSGCIALNNEQIEKLAGMVHSGTVVVIR